VVYKNIVVNNNGGEGRCVVFLRLKHVSNLTLKNGYAGKILLFTKLTPR